MPEETGLVTLTPELIKAGQSGPTGGWNKRQLAAIGVTWKDHQGTGWIQRNTGRVVTKEAYAMFLALIGNTAARRRQEAETLRMDSLFGD